MTQPPLTDRHVRTLIIGAGFAGLAAAIKLDEAGEHDFVVVERGAEVGGTWRDNTYPGAACDVPSQLYSYSFALNPAWSRSFSGQPEIQAYIRGVAEGAGVLDRFWFHTEVGEARWDDATQVWQVSTSQGTLTAETLIAGAGALSEPKNPDITGFETFAGRVFHSAAWDHDVSLAGARVGIIGTGASSIQIVPEVAQQADHLDVYQRTAPWVMPRHDRDYTRVERFAFARLPAVQRAYRTAIYWGRELYVPAFTAMPKLAAPAAWAARANIRRHISDPDLRAAVTPDFQIGCKRILISNRYYPALAQDNVELITSNITEVTEQGIRTSDGRLHKVDVIIVATGFHTTDLPIAHQIYGKQGLQLAKHFASEGMQAYKGTTVHGFPNLFFLVGPNTGLGHSSMVFMIESQVAYVLRALAHLRNSGTRAIEPKAEVQRAFVDGLQKRMKRTVWSVGGCASWYLDSHGRNVTLWPRTTFMFRRLLRSFDAHNYDVVRAKTTRLPVETLDEARLAGLLDHHDSRSTNQETPI